MTKFNSKDNTTDKYNNSSGKLNTLEKIDKQSKVSKSHNIKNKKGNKFISKCKKNINNFCKTTCKKINNLNCSNIFFDSSNNSSNSGSSNCINNQSISNINNIKDINNYSSCKSNNTKDINNYSSCKSNKINNYSNNCNIGNICKKKRKQKIPLAVKQNVWVTNFGEVYKHKCYVDWCHRVMTVFEFEVGHNIPESKGGTLDLNNLRPICHQCNIGMGNQYTIDEWSDQKFLDK